MSMNPILEIAINSTFSRVDIRKTYTNLKEINEQEKSLIPQNILDLKIYYTGKNILLF